MCIAGLFVIFGTEHDLNPRGSAADIGPENNRPLETIEKRGIGFQADDAALESRASYRYLFTQLAPDWRTISNAVCEKPITLSTPFGSLGRLDDQVIRI